MRHYPSAARTALLTGLAALGLVLAGLPALPAEAAPAPAVAGAPHLDLQAPASAAVGRDVTVRLVLTGAPSAAAWAGVLRYDPKAVTLGAVTTVPRLSAAAGAGRALPVVATRRGVSLGTWSCTTAPCLRSAGAVVAGPVTVATVHLVPLRSGRLSLALGAVSVVSAGGGGLPVVVGAGRTVAVGSSRAVLTLPAPPVAPVGTPRRSRSADVTHDGRVTAVDAAVEVADWQASQESGHPCDRRIPAAHDLDSDGCLSVGDIQRVGNALTDARVAGFGSKSANLTAATATPLVYTVTSTGDADDAAADNVCATSAKVCTLRAAVTEANRQTAPVRIEFNLAGTGVQTITLSSRVDFYNPAGITVDGYTQPGSSPNTDPLASNAVLKVQVAGLGYTDTGSDGFFLPTANNVIRGLAIYNMRREVWLTSTGSTGNRIVGNWICTDVTATAKATSVWAGSSGVALTQSANHNVIGAPTAADRNVLSGCSHHGIVTIDYGTSNNLFQNNIIGLSPDGLAALPNLSHGIDLNSGSQHNLTGGTGAMERNVLSGNGSEGQEISHDPLTVYNDIIGNFIGTDLTGAASPAYAHNAEWGVHLEGAATCSPCPDDAGFSRVTDNVIVGSGQGGVMVDKGRHDDVVAHNRIGLTSNGTAAGNTYFGVRVEKGATHTTIGPGNEIAYNDSGIQSQSVGAEPADSRSEPTNFNTFTRNSVHDNGGPGIDLAPLYGKNAPGTTDPNTNSGLDAPVLTGVTASSVSGTTCASCMVEVFLADRVGAGRTYLTTTTADSTGHFSTPLAGAAGMSVTATATDPKGSTSEYANPVPLPAAPPANVPPTAVVKVTCTGGTCSFDGSGSSDSDGKVVSWTWDFGDGSAGTGVTVSHRYATAGTYTVRLQVLDDGGATGSATTSHAVTPQPPVARAAATCTYANCHLDGSASTDPEGTITSWTWDYGDGSSGTGAVVDHYYAAPGSYPVTLTVRDDRGATGTTSKTVVVSSPDASVAASDSFTRTLTGAWGNADAGGPWTIAYADTAYSVDGNRGLVTSDPGTSRFAYLSGVSRRDLDMAVTFSASRVPDAPNGLTVAAVFRRTGQNTQYHSRVRLLPDGTVRLAFTKLTGTTQDAVLGDEVVVGRVASAGGTSYTLRLQANGASPTTLRARVWAAGSAEPSTWDLTRTDSEPALQTAGNAGFYSYQSTSSAGLTLAVDQLTVQSLAAPTMPVASFTSSCSSRTCSFDASGSTAGGTVTSYDWDFGDGTVGSGRTVSRTYAADGTYAPVLTVTDDLGQKSSRTGSVAVRNAPPTAAFASSCSSTACSFDASASADSDGTVTGYAWTFGDGSPAGTGVTVSHNYAPGTYTVGLTVTDNGGATGTRSAAVVVSAPAGPQASDTFTRMVSSGWGTADSGGSWSVQGTAANFSVDGTAGVLLTPSPGVGQGAYLRGVSTAGADVTASLRTDKVAEGGSGIYTYVVGRSLGTNLAYQLRVRLVPGGGVLVAPVKLLNSSADTLLAPEVSSGLTYTAGTKLRVRVLVSGSGTTTVAGKVWVDGTPEPAAWLVSATDTSPELQGPGSPGLYVYLSGKATNAPLRTFFDDLVSTRPSGP